YVSAARDDYADLVRRDLLVGTPDEVGGGAGDLGDATIDGDDLTHLHRADEHRRHEGREQRELQCRDAARVGSPGPEQQTGAKGKAMCQAVRHGELSKTGFATIVVHDRRPQL